MRYAVFVSMLAMACSSGSPADPMQPSASSGGTDGTGGKAAGSSGGSGGSVSTGGSAGTGGAGTTDPPDGSSDSGSVTMPPMGNPFVYVGSNQAESIQIFELDMESGELISRGSAPSGTSPTYLAFHPSRRFVYALNEIEAGRIEAFNVNAETGMLTRLNDASSGGNGPAHISTHKSGNWLLSSNYGSGHAAALPIGEDGRLGAPVDPVQAGEQAHMILDDGMSGDFVFVPSKGDNLVAQFEFDQTSGRLTANNPPSIAQTGQPRHMTFHPSGLYAFLLTESARSIVSYRYDASQGLLSEPVAVPRGQSGTGAHIEMHPTKEVVYASLRGDNSIQILSVNAQGRAESAGEVRQGISTPWDFDVDPSGRYLLVANSASNQITVYGIDDSGTTLTMIGDGVSVAAGPRFVGVMHPPEL